MTFSQFASLLVVEVHRFREGSADPSSEPVTIDMLDTLLERVESAAHMAEGFEASR